MQRLMLLFLILHTDILQMLSAQCDMIKEKFPDLQVIAGNVATGEATEASDRSRS